MAMTRKILLAWSSGKDSALTLYELQRAGGFEVAALLTTVTEGYDRVSMHGVRRRLLERQAASLELPLEAVSISPNASNAEYEGKMGEALTRYQEEGVSAVAFGDLYLEDVRKYREDNLARIGMQGIFPLWGRDTTALAQAFIDAGFEAVVTCVDSQALDKKFVGRRFDATLLLELPPDVDPCGENGEFHTFVYSGPIFQERLAFKTGEVVLRENRFYFCDLVPVF
jgi:uncharacterized protein (TIGR00290 family)